ncbi:MAG: hypothetical protein Q9166_004000 [cf. Caloplaca sp. 2 TL-2023]
MTGIGEASAILTVAQLGIGLSNTLFAYISEARDASSHIERIGNEVLITSERLREIGVLVNANSQTHTFSDEGVRCAVRCSEDCHAILHELKSILFKSGWSDRPDGQERDAVDLSLFSTIRWPFLRTKLEAPRAELAKIKLDLTLIFTSALAYRASSVTEQAKFRQDIPGLTRSKEWATKMVEQARKRAHNRERDIWTKGGGEDWIQGEPEVFQDFVNYQERCMRDEEDKRLRERAALLLIEQQEAAKKAEEKRRQLEEEILEKHRLKQEAIKLRAAQREEDLRNELERAGLEPDQIDIVITSSSFRHSAVDGTTIPRDRPVGISRKASDSAWLLDVFSLERVRIWPSSEWFHAERAEALTNGDVWHDFAQLEPLWRMAVLRFLNVKNQDKVDSWTLLSIKIPKRSFWARMVGRRSDDHLIQLVLIGNRLRLPPQSANDGKPPETLSKPVTAEPRMNLPQKPRAIGSKLRGKITDRHRTRSSKEPAEEQFQQVCEDPLESGDEGSWLGWPDELPTPRPTSREDYLERDTHLPPRPTEMGEESYSHSVPGRQLMVFRRPKPEAKQTKSFERQRPIERQSDLHWQDRRFSSESPQEQMKSPHGQLKRSDTVEGIEEKRPRRVHRYHSYDEEKTIPQRPDLCLPKSPFLNQDRALVLHPSGSRRAEDHMRERRLANSLVVRDELGPGDLTAKKGRLRFKARQGRPIEYRRTRLKQRFRSDTNEDSEDKDNVRILTPRRQTSSKIKLGEEEIILRTLKKFTTFRTDTSPAATPDGQASTAVPSVPKNFEQEEVGIGLQTDRIALQETSGIPTQPLNGIAASIPLAMEGVDYFQNRIEDPSGSHERDGEGSSAEKTLYRQGIGIGIMLDEPAVIPDQEQPSRASRSDIVRRSIQFADKAIARKERAGPDTGCDVSSTQNPNHGGIEHSRQRSTRIDMGNKVGVKNLIHAGDVAINPSDGSQSDDERRISVTCMEKSPTPISRSATVEDISVDHDGVP